MKKLACLAVLILFSFSAFAQRGLNCNAVFRGKVVPSNRMIETEVRGESVSTYKLSYFHSIKVQVDEVTATKIAGIIELDVDNAVSAETEYDGDRLIYAMVELQPFRRVNRYLCYQLKQTAGAEAITIIYLEGSASLNELHHMFEKR